MIDKWIEQLKNGLCIPEADLKKLCNIVSSVDNSGVIGPILLTLTPTLSQGEKLAYGRSKCSAGESSSYGELIVTHFANSESVRYPIASETYHSQLKPYVPPRYAVIFTDNFLIYWSLFEPAGSLQERVIYLWCEILGVNNALF